MQVSVPDVSSRSLAELVSLNGRRAVVTGAGRGLGRAIAGRLAEAGADVLVADIEHGLATTVAEELNSRHPGRAAAAHVDVAAREASSTPPISLSGSWAESTSGSTTPVSSPAFPRWRCPRRPGTRCSP